MTTIERVKMDMRANEPWPKDVQLFQPYEVEQILLPDNANCLAVQAFLKMNSLQYKISAKSNAEAMSPSGKVPFIKCGQFLVSELEGIVQFCSSKGISLSNSLDDSQKSDMRVYMSLIHTVLEPAENYVCYMDNETYSKITKPRAGSVYPFPLNHIKCYEKRNEEIKKLKLLKWHQKSLDEVYDEVGQCCESLSQRLGDNKYFFGGKATECDAIVYAHLYTIFTNPLPNDDNEFMLRVGKYDKLVNFTKNFDKEVMGRETNFEMKKYSEYEGGVVVSEASAAPTPEEGPRTSECNKCPETENPPEEPAPAEEAPAPEEPPPEEPAPEEPPPPAADEAAPAESETPAEGEEERK